MDVWQRLGVLQTMLDASYCQDLEKIDDFIQVYMIQV